MKPLISVIIPVYNCEKTIETAINSILDQTYQNTEVIVVDDGSDDKTKEVVYRMAKIDKRILLIDSDTSDSYRFDTKLNRNINAGYSARNTGFKHSRGEYITFQDADDASLLNRIEVQYILLNKYRSTHVTLDWIQFDESLIGKKLDFERYISDKKLKYTDPDELYCMARRSRGFISKISTKLNRMIPFHIKRLRVINKLFFGTLENYPGTGNSPLFKREVIEKVQFRKLSDRIWPSFMGRGADRDFNFQVAETFHNSHVFSIPLYMWRQLRQNERYIDGISSYIID